MQNLPKSAASYYVQLYCKKKQIKQHENNQINLLSEATRSWFSLSASKKKIFLMKYNNCHLKLRKRFANKLRSATSFPDQSIQLGQNSINSIDRSTPPRDVGYDDSPVDLFLNRNSIDHNSCSLSNAEKVHQSDNNNDIQQNLSNLNNDQESIHEPITPAFSKTKDLYYIIKKKSEDVVPWETLSRAQKAPYMTTACRIKRLYLMEYTNYLESLSNENLLAHYKNKIQHN